MNLFFKPFDDMTPEDYADIGLMCGLEVHQQLLTKRKLFCHCPAGRYSSAYDAEILRQMRPTLSELGEYDGTALMEKKTRKNIYYRIHRDTVCTYDIDDTPPFFPDDQAIDIALEVALLLNLNMVGEMHIARKQYLDGSIPAGFQRTAILGVSGWIPYKDRRIGIRQLSIEEDSCREVTDVGHERVLLTDRLGMPLVETVTEPEMYTPRATAEVCQIIRMLCRATGKVRTGYGAGRQDVNVSVRGGTRIEIKGVPQIKRIPLLVYNEARRQWSLLQIRDELKRRGITTDTFSWTATDVTRNVRKTHFPPIRDALGHGQRVQCVVLRGFAGLLNLEIQEYTTFGKEFSDRVRVIACLTRQPNIVHSDTASELLSVRDWKELRRRAKSGDQDALVLVWGDEADVRTACEEIAVRAREATLGVPSDTRQALKDGTNGFERVLPGAERMYPDTDLPPMNIAPQRLDRIAALLPPKPWDREKRYRKLGLSDHAIHVLFRRNRATLFERLMDELGIDPGFATRILVEQFTAFSREGLPIYSLCDDDVFEVFKALAAGDFSQEGVTIVLGRALRTPIDIAFDGSHVAAELNEFPPPATVDELDTRIQAHLSNGEAAGKPASKTHRIIMGRLMAEFRGRLHGTLIAERLRDSQLKVAEGT